MSLSKTGLNCGHLDPLRLRSYFTHYCKPFNNIFFQKISLSYFDESSPFKVNFIHTLYFWYQCKQANSKNCGPPPGNKFDLEIGQRSRSRSAHGTNRQGLSQWSCMPSINALSLILQKIWARLKFLWRTEGQTDEWDLMSPRFRKSGGQQWYKFEAWWSRVILSCTCTALCYNILEYTSIYIGQIAEVLCLLSTCKTQPNTLPDVVRVTVWQTFLYRTFV